MTTSNSGGWTGGLYQPLSKAQVERLHHAALDILENVGFTYESGLDDTLALLESAGARVDREKARIYFPPDLIESQAAAAPERVVLYSRDGQNDLDLSGDRVYMGTGGLAVTILDLESGEARQSQLDDLYNIGRLVDKLDNIHFFLRPCTAFDVPVDRHDINCMYASLKGTTKHFMCGAADVAAVREMIELGAMVVGGMDQLVERPIFSLTACFAISPLKLCTQSTLNMQEACRNKIPIALSSAPMAGTTSPMTMAGTLVQVHAEELVGITIGQLTRPGAPMLYGGIPGAANMRNGGYQGGSVECGMMNAAIHQMAAHIKVPNYNSSGLTDAKIPDGQAAWEKSFTSLLAAMGGSNFVHHAAGMLESMRAVAFEQYVIDDEIIGMCARVLQGITLDDDHLGLDVIAAAGPGGEFLTAEHTFGHMRTEFMEGNGVSDRQIRDTWEADGALDARERAREIARKILREEAAPWVDAETDSAIRQRFDIQF